MSVLKLLPFCDSRGKALFGVTAATLMWNTAVSPLGGEMLSCRNGADLHPTTTLYVLAPLSLAFDDL